MANNNYYRSCRYCGKKVKVKDAYHHDIKNDFFYVYCSEDEYNKDKKALEMYELILDIFAEWKNISSSIQTLIEDYSFMYSDELLYSYLTNNKWDIVKKVRYRKTFQNKVNALKDMLEEELPTYELPEMVKKEDDGPKYVEYSDYYKYKPKKKKPTLAEYEDMVGD